jgi:dCMP deaminase
MLIALDLSTLSTCDRKQVGAVIIRDGRCISWGYNGAPPGLPHCHHLPGDEECFDAIHAELNAVAFAARQGISTEGATLFVTCSPCLRCSQALIASGISEVVYGEDYRDPAGRELLVKAGVQCSRIDQPSIT